MRVCRASVSLQAAAAETTYARIHPVANYMTVKGATQPSKGLLMGQIEGVLSQTSAVDPSGPEPDIAFIQKHQKEAER